MSRWVVAVLLLMVCVCVYWPQRHASFVLDDYYTVVRDPFIKNPSLYRDIWSSRLFDAHQSAGYIKFGYYRPVLQSSWILDYRLFGLKASGYQWVNLFIHALNCFLIYILLEGLFGQISLALKTSALFCVLPTQEWVVRYVTGRGDELSALFALIALILLLRVFRTGLKKGYIAVLVFWLLSALTREVAISYILYAFLIYYFFKINPSPQVGGGKTVVTNRFCLYWVLIGVLPLFLLWSIIPKQGNILFWHVFYFASVGFCLWMAQLRLRWIIVLVALFAAVSFYQGRFWTTEENLLRHTRNLEWWPHTVIDQQLLMKYDDDIPAINGMVAQSRVPMVKAMWLRRLGVVYFDHRDLSHAQEYFTQAIMLRPSDVDTLNALAVISHYQGKEDESLRLLDLALKINPSYPDTLKTLGIYYDAHHDLPKARMFLNRCLAVDPDNTQAHQLLDLVNVKG